MLLREEVYETRILKEGEGDAKRWYINGPFVQANVVNKNKRIYPLNVMEQAVRNYEKEYIKEGRAIGELGHPETLTVNLDKIALKIESMNQEGNNFIGKALVLNTPAGKCLIGLLEGGVKIGVSSRGMGSVMPNRSGINEVQNDFGIIAVDSVFHPSAPAAFVNGLMEGQNWVWDQKEKDVALLESIRDDVKRANKRRLEETYLQSFTKFMKILKA